MRRLQRPAGSAADGASRPGRKRGWQRAGTRACAAFLTTAALALPAAGDEPLREGELPNWIPSVGAGFGIHTRDVSGRIDNPGNPFGGFASINPLFGGALLPTGVGVNEPRFSCRIAGAFVGFCFFLDDATEAVDGSTLPFSAQLIGPPEPFLGLVRPFVHGAFAIDFDSRVIASSGIKPGGFPAAGVLPRLRVQLEARPQNTWWAGGGLAFQVPIDRPLLLKVGYNYSRHEMDLEGSIWREIIIANQPTIERLNSYDDLSITSYGPSFGLEAEVWRVGEVAMNLSADLLIFFPRSGTDTRFSVNAPLAPNDAGYCGEPSSPANCVQPAFLTVDADDTQYHGSLTLRLTWLGIPF